MALSSEDVEELSKCELAEIDYRPRCGTAGPRKVRIEQVAADRLYAFCYLRKDSREFRYDRIVGWQKLEDDEHQREFAQAGKLTRSGVGWYDYGQEGRVSAAELPFELGEAAIDPPLGGGGWLLFRAGLSDRSQAEDLIEIFDREIRWQVSPPADPAAPWEDSYQPEIGGWEVGFDQRRQTVVGWIAASDGEAELLEALKHELLRWPKRYRAVETIKVHLDGQPM
jgi:hypothetical protein